MIYFLCILLYFTGGICCVNLYFLTESYKTEPNKLYILGWFLFWPLLTVVYFLILSVWAIGDSIKEMVTALKK